MRKFCKYIEKGKWLAEYSNCEASFNLILWHGESCWFWFRIGKLGKRYFRLEMFDKMIINTSN
jgi:hypothetical protein